MLARLGSPSRALPWTQSPDPSPTDETARVYRGHAVEGTKIVIDNRGPRQRLSAQIALCAYLVRIWCGFTVRFYCVFTVRFYCVRFYCVFSAFFLRQIKKGGENGIKNRDKRNIL